MLEHSSMTSVKVLTLISELKEEKKKVDSGYVC